MDSIEANIQFDDTYNRRTTNKCITRTAVDTDGQKLLHPTLANGIRRKKEMVTDICQRWIYDPCEDEQASAYLFQQFFCQQKCKYYVAKSVDLLAHHPVLLEIGNM